jgi:hypothetical protein
MIGNVPGLPVVSLPLIIVLRCDSAMKRANHPGRIESAFEPGQPELNMDVRRLLTSARSRRVGGTDPTGNLVCVS